MKWESTQLGTWLTRLCWGESLVFLTGPPITMQWMAPRVGDDPFWVSSSHQALWEQVPWRGQVSVHVAAHTNPAAAASRGQLIPTCWAALLQPQVVSGRKITKNWSTAKDRWHGQKGRPFNGRSATGHHSALDASLSAAGNRSTMMLTILLIPLVSILWTWFIS